MDKTIELVNRWAEFAKDHPEGSIEDFCRHLLISQRETENKGRLVGGVIPIQSDGLLMKIIGRIHKLHVSYAYLAFEATPINQLEEFGFLASIRQQKNPKKSDVIYSNLMELSSGTDMLNRLRNKGLIKESGDKEDKRAKRVMLTLLGEKTFVICIDRIQNLAKMMLHDMPEDDKQLCIQLLKHIEIKFSSLVQGHKGMKFEEIYKEVAAEPMSRAKKSKR